MAVETNASRVDEGPQQTDHGVQPSRELKHPKAFSGTALSAFIFLNLVTSIIHLLFEVFHKVHLLLKFDRK